MGYKRLNRLHVRFRNQYRSRLFLDMSDPGNSTIEKFKDTTISEIPFQASFDINTAVVDISLSHQIQVGFLFVTTHAVVGAGVYLNLPKYTAEFAKVEGVDETCTALSQSQNSNRDIAQKILTDAYRIKPSVGWQVGVAGEYSFLLGSGSFDVPFGNGTFSNLANSCLLFNKTSGTYLDAKQAVADAKKMEL
ncbi:hypothetical protein CC86DRAFT_43274 [Ophiobolus disseminans]|uniref:Uncharacterized protein n=1 Tax=Ophiobolus disseminans TaxID=1469910 RepID=A0A6A6ZYF7_9PLEO|nr:hypothetical protein CC86DRAFT_43274 [Ophiobolus disseminans]